MWGFLNPKQVWGTQEGASYNAVPFWSFVSIGCLHCQCHLATLGSRGRGLGRVQPQRCPVHVRTLQAGRTQGISHAVWFLQHQKARASKNVLLRLKAPPRPPGLELPPFSSRLGLRC